MKTQPLSNEEMKETNGGYMPVAPTPPASQQPGDPGMTDQPLDDGHMHFTVDNTLHPTKDHPMM